jgi:periplasmic protein TonB
MPARQDTPRTSNSSAMKIVPILVILIAIAAAAYYFFVYSGGSSTAPVAVKPIAAPTSAATTAAPAASAAAPAAVVPDMTKEQLLKEASAAFREQRYVAPPGNNALEYYLRVLEKEPNNPSARDALREGFSLFTGPAEQDINAGNLDEANRVIDLLTKVDPNNFTLNILRSKLDAKKRQVDHDQQVAAAAAARAAAAPAQAAQNSQSAAAPATAPSEPAAAPAAAPVQTAAVTPPTPRPQPAAAAPAPPPVQAPAATASGGESHAAELVRAVQPDYPPDAYRSRAQGWVEVEFTVTADGAVSNAQVVNAEPSRIFNSAALNAVRRWSFKPKVENGKAVDDRIRRRIEFKLS